jgi:hypothetical protein
METYDSSLRVSVAFEKGDTPYYLSGTNLNCHRTSISTFGNICFTFRNRGTFYQEEKDPFCLTKPIIDPRSGKRVNLTTVLLTDD